MTNVYSIPVMFVQQAESSVVTMTTVVEKGVTFQGNQTTIDKLAQRHSTIGQNGLPMETQQWY